MSEQKDVKWITVNGTHIPIKDGQTAKQATQAFLAKQGATRSTKASASPSDTTGIKQQVQASKDNIAKTKVVAVIPKGKMITDYQTALTAARVKLANNGGVVKRKGVGDVQVGAVLKKARKYMKTPAEIAAIAAIPDRKSVV